MECRQALHECSNYYSACGNAFCGRCCNLLDQIERAGSKSICRRKMTLFLKGQVPRGVFILCTGRAKLSTSSISGKAIITRISQAGDVLGLNAVVAGRAYSVTAEMMDTGQVMFISRDAFLRMMKEHGQIAVAAAEQLSRSYYPAHEMLRTLGLGTHPAERLAKFLLSWTDGLVTDCHETYSERFNLSLTHQEIADSIGSTRETVSRLFSELRKNGSLSLKEPHLQSRIAWDWRAWCSSEVQLASAPATMLLASLAINLLSGSRMLENAVLHGLGTR